MGTLHHCRPVCDVSSACVRIRLLTGCALLGKYRLGYATGAKGEVADIFKKHMNSDTWFYYAVCNLHPLSALFVCVCVGVLPSFSNSILGAGSSKLKSVPRRKKTRAWRRFWSGLRPVALAPLPKFDHKPKAGSTALKLSSSILHSQG